MADFEKAYKRTMKNEGGAFGYSNNPKDPGGETIMGISRINWPQWPDGHLWIKPNKDPPFLSIWDIILKSHDW